MPRRQKRDNVVSAPEAEARSSHPNLDQNQKVEEVITITDNPGGPLLAERVFDEPCHMFLDTGARIELISLDFLRKAKPGLVIIEPTTFSIRGALKSPPTTKRTKHHALSEALQICFRSCNRVDAVAGSVDLQGKG